MPTQEQLDHNVGEFERQYPESLSDRIEWWIDALGLDHTRFVRLLGLSPAEAARTVRTDLPEVVNSREEQAEVVDDMLGHLLATFDFDLPALRMAMQRPAAPSSGEPCRGTRPLDDVVPLPYAPSPHVRDGILLNQIFAGGDFALRTLQAYLSETGTAQGWQDGRKG